MNTLVSSVLVLPSLPSFLSSSLLSSLHASLSLSFFLSPFCLYCPLFLFCFVFYFAKPLSPKTFWSFWPPFMLFDFLSSSLLKTWLRPITVLSYFELFVFGKHPDTPCEYLRHPEVLKNKITLHFPWINTFIKFLKGFRQTKRNQSFCWICNSICRNKQHDFWILLFCSSFLRT
jgi:hypothetical protein